MKIETESAQLTFGYLLQTFKNPTTKSFAIFFHFNCNKYYSLCFHNYSSLALIRDVKTDDQIQGQDEYLVATSTAKPSYATDTPL